MKKLLLFTITLFILTQVNAQGWGQTQKVVPNDRYLGQQFGSTVAIDGNYAIVGVLVSNTAAEAYIFENDGSGNWTQIQKLESPNNNQFDHFGTAVAISGDYIFIGALGQDYDANGNNFIQGAGAVYVFKKQASGSFDFEQKIVASDREMNNHFGSTIDLNDDYAIIGSLRQAYDVDGNNFLENAGAAYIFKRDGTGAWNEVQKIVASDRAANDYFAGDAVSIDDNYAVVGAKFESEDENGINTLSFAGSVYVFERDGSGTWNETQKIVASNRQGSELFGKDVSVHNNYLIVGAEQGNVIGGYTGSAYLFERDGSGVWNETQEIIASDAIAFDKFGQSVSIDNNHVIVGAYLKDYIEGSTTYPGVGRAYVFERDGSGVWNQIQNIYDEDRDSNDFFGYDVAISGDTAIVGAYQEDEDENEVNTLFEAGSAYIFDANEPSTLSIVENTFGFVLKTYPNPTNGEITIDLGENYNRISVSVINMLGQEIKTQNLHSSNKITITLNDKKGIYFVNISTEEGKSAVIKILKE